ncbi:pilus assembly protein PilP [Candidatus Aminicenantes bacterium AC-708-M15]|jgi:Tfp pilus assembly protein PilP|nr:pilus assembly protein PilP [SCandidatus Aminicenantes bacterium Aminicenantia_JdfR_composite]MCP2596354.1 pilus assembly protein PilP [Candidatus Aminicenantes bacterium AC-335-G13]MCP2598519.1 pilus assembly protein PilP [Candidatus Aminicenantes bacterium AC-335-L06]MCP2599023.1 pilus assembly protein PilP [Candidatus Aminicenantes bacterium AC-335-B20]MCP2604116.1 pilus assembly protein PilP [Candidatus Aminicenantes bacterium AC-708-M15]MCP2605405.1 pilus assembly protein PilP [Candida
MRKFIILSLSILLISNFLFLQEKKSEIKKEEIKIKKFFYNPAGRRDPFRDLLKGPVLEERPKKPGREGLSVGEIVLRGIAKVKGKYIAIVNGPDGFPYFVKKGDKFYDGYVLSIDENKIILRQLLPRPIGGKKYKDIIKKLESD